MNICLFDIDGTILKTGGAGKAAMESALATAFGAKPSADGIPFSGRTDRAIGRDLFRLHDIDDTEKNWRLFAEAYLDHLPDHLGRAPGEILPGIKSFLEWTGGQQDVAVGLLTGNIRAGARLKLGHYGLYHHFAFGGFGDHHHDRDQVAHAAATAARQHLKASIDPRQVWVIGDTPLDVRCARAIGARAVAVATGWHSVAELAASAPDLLLTDLSDHTPLVALWQSNN